MSKVYIALQDNEESHYIVEAIEEDNPGFPKGARCQRQH